MYKIQEADVGGRMIPTENVGHPGSSKAKGWSNRNGII